MKLNTTALALLLAAAGAFAQGKTPAQSTTASQPAQTAAQTSATAAAGSKAPTASAAAATTPLELARATYTALGGDKYRDLKNMVLVGTVDLYQPNSTQSMAGKFGLITAGDKMREEVQSPIVSMSLVFDGERTYSSLRGFELPPANKFGMPVLMKFDREGYAVTALPEKKKVRGFRITDPEGNVTNFYVDPVTARLMRFEVPFGDYTYGVEFKSLKEVDGVLVPVSFVQRLSTAQVSFFAEFKVKDVKLNQNLPADTFAIPEK